MMTLDEAIKHARDKAEESREYIVDDCNLEPFEAHCNSQCIKCAEEHEQLAEWLQELKNYRKQEKMTNVLFLPCGIGDDVYCIEKTIECKYDYSDECPMDNKWAYCGSEVDSFICCKYQYKRPTVVHRLFELNMLDKFAKTVFLTLEEAKEKLKEMENVK